MSIPLIGPLIFWFKSKLLRIFSSSYDEGWTKEGSLMGKPVAKERMVFCCAPDEQWSHLSISKVGEHYVIHDQTAKVLNNINRLHLFVFALNYKHYYVHTKKIIRWCQNQPISGVWQRRTRPWGAIDELLLSLRWEKNTLSETRANTFHNQNTFSIPKSKAS